MKTIKIDFRKFPEKPIIDANFELNINQKMALEALPPVVDILNLDVETEGHHILIEKATCQYYDNQEHKFSNFIPMLHNEIADMLYHSTDNNIMEFLTNNIPENG